MSRKFSIRVERDRSFDADDNGGWTVTKYHRTGWSVLFRGDLAECQEFAQSEVEAMRWIAGTAA